jgi:hypothetical protein
MSEEEIKLDTCYLERMELVNPTAYKPARNAGIYLKLSEVFDSRNPACRGRQERFKNEWRRLRTEEERKQYHAEFWGEQVRLLMDEYRTTNVLVPRYVTITGGSFSAQWVDDLPSSTYYCYPKKTVTYPFVDYNRNPQRYRKEKVRKKTFRRIRRVVKSLGYERDESITFGEEDNIQAVYRMDGSRNGGLAGYRTDAYLGRDSVWICGWGEEIKIYSYTPKEINNSIRGKIMELYPRMIPPDSDIEEVN